MGFCAVSHFILAGWVPAHIICSLGGCLCSEEGRRVEFMRQLYIQNISVIVQMPRSGYCKIVYNDIEHSKDNRNISVNYVHKIFWKAVGE